MSSHESQAAGRATLTHFDRAGRARMVDVGEKPETERVAVASGRVRMAGETIELIRTGRAAKGDVLAVAQVAAVMGAKKTADLIPMCHPLMLTQIDVAFEMGQDEVRIEATVATRGRTGVEMEALTAECRSRRSGWSQRSEVGRVAGVVTRRLRQLSPQSMPTDCPRRKDRCTDGSDPLRTIAGSGNR